MKNHNQNLLIIILLNNLPYHAAFLAKDYGIFDLSLLASRLTNEEVFFNSQFSYKFFEIQKEKISESINFFFKPCNITKKIIDKERKNRGWYRTEESPDYILKFRNIRSKITSDMNCIEWIVHGLDLSETKIPDNILTADQLFKWSNINLVNVNYKFKNYE